MTVDVNVVSLEADFFDNLDEIMEDTMVQMFILHPRERTMLETVREQAAEHGCIFYSVPAELGDDADTNCVGYAVEKAEELGSLPPGKPLFVDEACLDEALCTALERSGASGIILNATHPHPRLERFRLAIGPETVERFDGEALGALPMERIVLQSRYPEADFEAIDTTVKRISDAMFRPEQSIIAAATRSSLELLGFRNR